MNNLIFTGNSVDATDDSELNDTCPICGSYLNDKGICDDCKEAEKENYDD